MGGDNDESDYSGVHDHRGTMAMLLLLLLLIVMMTKMIMMMVMKQMILKITMIISLQHRSRAASSCSTCWELRDSLPSRA